MARARKKKVQTLDPWRRPDFDGQEHGFESVWWGPGDIPEDAEGFTEVRDTCVTEYRFVGGYEGFDDDDWLVISTCLDEDDLPSKPVWYQGRTLHPDDHRVVAAYGVNQISERGGEEDIWQTSDVMERFGHMRRENNRGHRAPARKLKNRLMR